MEIQLQELIDQIKKDGVAAAEIEADTILSSAKSEAEKIISDAKALAEKIINDAKNENDRIVRSSEDAIRQAGRNLLISFRESVTKELKAIVNDNVTAVYSSETFAQIITNAVQSWNANPDAEDVTLLLNADDLKVLEESSVLALKDNLTKGVTLKANDNFDGGFRIAVNNGEAYYDYSTEAVVDMLSNYLSPKVTELLKEAE